MEQVSCLTRGKEVKIARTSVGVCIPTNCLSLSILHVYLFLR
jgi:hypothetical protein